MFSSALPDPSFFSAFLFYAVATPYVTNFTAARFRVRRWWCARGGTAPSPYRGTASTSNLRKFSLDHRDEAKKTSARKLLPETL
ncbi:hypothetical protein EVAR_27430_1 [Eumeta japonica]|uniref:Uncharacterized protein n=1 Tax=Eumeta variegata TaxID=151549 RepID=A0A4C1VKZ3_EUMVA|nr:hypothetical protein EVAR_27430_1 [Eumeta japonica]